MLAVFRAQALRALKSRSPGSLAFLDTLWPPAEARGRAGEIAPTLEGRTAGELHLFQFVEGREVAVDQRCIGERPEVLSRLQLRRIGWQEQKMDMLGHPQSDAGMPPGAVEHEDDLLLGAGADLPGEGGEFHLEQVDADRGGQVEDGAPRADRGGVDEAHQPTPGEAVLHRGVGPRAGRRPRAAQERFEPDAMLVGRHHSPQLDRRLGEGVGHRTDEPPYVF
jgi:hypothetical protein